jgi:hypothetical protein
MHHLVATRAKRAIFLYLGEVPPAAAAFAVGGLFDVGFSPLY